jgi:Caspase domain
MKRLKLFSTNLLTVFFLTGCLSVPELIPPQQVPSYVRTIKYVRLYGYEAKKDTGIDVTEGEFLSILAKGTIYLSRYGAQRDISQESNKFVKFIDDHIAGSGFSPWYREGILSASRSGRLYLGISDSDLQDNSGYFDVTIIVWREADFSKIADFLTILHEKYPDHFGIEYALYQALYLKKINLAKTETFEAIETTQKQIQEIKQEDHQKAGTVIASGDERVRELEARLADLTAKLKELDNLSRQLQQESQKSAQLSRMLEEKEGREQELMSKLGEGAKVAPLLLITSPEHELRTEADSVRLSGAAEDDIGLMRLEVFVNGKPAPDTEPRGLKSVPGEAPRRINFERQVPLVQGENYIQIKVTDTDGLKAERTLIVHYSPSRRNAWAVVVGINRYPRMPQLKYAVNDAREFYRLLVERNHLPAENITLLLDEQATLRNLRSALGTGLKAAAGTRDIVMIFFAGHGATERDATSTDSDGLEKYLLAWDTDPGDLYSSALPMREIAHIFERIRSERLVFLADTCYSGASGGRTVGIAGIRSNVSGMFLDRIVGGRGKVIITASAANEVSVERDELQHGVFTFYLLEGLRGAADTDRDGMVTVDEIYRYVSEKVPRATGQEQNPVMKGSVEGSLVLSLTR